MIIRFDKSFVKDYQKLPELQKKKVDKQLRLIKEDLHHPSLNAHKLGGSSVWEARVDYHYRMTFRTEGIFVFMRRVGTHEIYRKP